MAHVSAETDAAAGAGAALPAPALALVSWASPRLVAAQELSHLDTAGPLPAGGDPRPRLSGARPGISTRLLI
jgi:hypothetical protein